MNSYRVFQVARLLEIRDCYVRDCLKAMNITRIEETKSYTFHQLFLAKDQLELKSHKIMYFDFDKEEITIIKKSKLCQQ